MLGYVSDIEVKHSQEPTQDGTHITWLSSEVVPEHTIVKVLVGPLRDSTRQGRLANTFQPGDSNDRPEIICPL